MTLRILFPTALLCALALFSCTNQSKTNRPDTVVPYKVHPTEAVSDSEENMRNSRAGSFVYFADAAVFTDCSTDESFHVASFAGDYREEESYYTLETQYLQEVEEPGLLLYIEIEGYYVEEEEEGMGQTIVPVHFNLISQEEAGCKE